VAESASDAQLKQRARATWAAGRFDNIAQFTRQVGRDLVDRVGIEPDMTVLDVACGTGNATIPAALAGGRTTGVDITPELFDDGRRNAAEAGRQIDWVEGDAEALPFADGSFERVVSAFGVMFAPRHAVAAAELARVCAPGGVIGLASWTPSGLKGQMFKMVAARMPAPPSFASPPPLWGDEAHVRELLEPHGLEITCERVDAIMRADSAEQIVEVMEHSFGPWQMAKAALGDEWPGLREQLTGLYRDNVKPHDDRVAAFAEYLVVVAKKPAG
jgi:ubiquinone/menaquinone biosynthesis C-methylase UbiE